ncbi:MAG: site-specific DNA-methyltransferase [Nitrospirae bacterium]|nr:site-specific DNA-methyltransferase [Nitrospirota bacterium]
MAKKKTNKLTVETLKHEEASRKNIPTAEHQSVMYDAEKNPIRVAYERRNRDLDPQLVWRGKDMQDWSDLIVHAPPLYIQEKVQPKVIIDDLVVNSAKWLVDSKKQATQIDLFADFNGLPSESAKTEFYQHDAHWANRMILGDSLQVMASLAEREGLRGKVQMIYFDPPYGIKFNSNFQWSTTSRDVKDGNVDHITREPEQVKAFRDTWRNGIHSYLTYLRDRLTVARDLLTESGSIFVQIGDENVHRVRAVMDEVFGDENFVSLIKFKTTGGRASDLLDKVTNYLLWYGKRTEQIKFRKLLQTKSEEELDLFEWIELHDGIISRSTIENRASGKCYMLTDLTSQGDGNPEDTFVFQDRSYYSRSGRHWTTNSVGRNVLVKAGRVQKKGENVFYRKYVDDYPVRVIGDLWLDTAMGGFKKNQEKIYVVQTSTSAIQRCLLMTTDPGDLVLDPTCGSGTTAYVAEQWGRRWITIDTSRVALALARARIMGARYPYYLLADSRDGQLKEAEVTRTAPSSQPTRGDIRHGFVYERVPHITLKSIANNAEIDVIWEKYEQRLAPLREELSVKIGKQKTLEEWEIPREMPENYPLATQPLFTAFWEQRIARQKEIDASIASKAEFEYLYDKPYDDKKKVRVAGPFTVESLSPHRVLAVGADDELIDSVAESNEGYGGERDFVQMILENLKTAGVQQAHKEDKITFTSLTPWPGDMVCAEGRYMERPSPQPSPQRGEGVEVEKRAAIFIGPEFGTVSRPDLVAAAREAGDAGFDVLITCAFNYDAHSSEFNKLGRIPVLKARMNADLHMADDLKNTGKGNLFVIFGEPDINILDAEDGQIKVKVNGVDVFHPNTGEVRSDGAEGIACWFIDTDYNEESFFVRHAYFLGANDPYKALKTTLKAEINEDAWATLNSDTSRPFDKPKTGRIAVKVINHLGDEVMKVFRV